MAEEKAVDEIVDEDDAIAESEEEEAEEGEGKDKIINADTYEPLIRKTPADYVAERRGKKIEKLEKELGSKEEGGEYFDKEGEKVDVAGLVRKQIQESLHPVLDSIRSSMDDSEINTFLSKQENAKFRKFEALARKESRVYQNVPIAKIFKSLAFEEAEKIGADKSKEGDKGKKRISGNPVRKGVGELPDFKKMPDKEFSDYQQRVQTGEKIRLE